MTDDAKRRESLAAKLKDRQQAEKFKHQDVGSKLNQAQAIALRLLGIEHGESESVEEVLEVASTCIAVLSECTDVLASTDVNAIVNLPDEKMLKEKPSQ
ncbi:hypothetical protein RYB67_10495 [Pseudomonas syringae]|nr:hypothetical protein [Pseudomonas syringae]